MEGHDKKFEDMEKPYQENVVNARGVVITVAGLAVVCVISFVLMWVLQVTLDDRAAADEELGPLRLSAEERLPQGPRLQGAPGFGVETKDGLVNLELREPQAEYRVLLKEWETLWKEGEKDPDTGKVIAIPIEDAKKRLLESGAVKTSAPGSDAPATPADDGSAEEPAEAEEEPAAKANAAGQQ